MQLLLTVHPSAPHKCPETANSLQLQQRCFGFTSWTYRALVRSLEALLYMESLQKSNKSYESKIYNSMFPDIFEYYTLLDY